jgi:DNA-binding MarR family transcriptional regulator
MQGDDILDQLRKIIRGLNLESKRVQKECGISIPQLLCLNHLRQSTAFQSTTKALSERLNLNPSTISGIVSRLEKRGYVARLPKREDRRVTYISLTAEGERMFEQAPDLLDQQLNERIASLPAQTQASLSEALDILINLLPVKPSEKGSLMTDALDMLPEHGPGTLVLPSTEDLPAGDQAA